MMEHLSVDAADDALLAHVISQRKAIFLSENSHLGHEECQRQWDRKVARIASISTPHEPSSQAHSLNAGALGVEQKMCRSNSMPMKKRRLESGASQNIEPESSPIEGSRTMQRKRSNLSHHTIMPAINTMHQAPSVPFDLWEASELPYSVHNSTTSSTIQSVPRNRRNPRQLSTRSYDDPAAFCTDNAIPSPMDLDTNSTTRRLSISWPNYQYPSSNLSTSPYSETFTSPVDLQTNATSIGMSRAPSGAGTSVCRGMENMRLVSPTISRCASNVGQSFNNSFNTDLTSNFMHEPSTSTASFDPRQVLSHMGGAADDKKLTEAFNHTASDVIDEENGDVKMERTSSSKSNSSATSRINRRTREHAASSTRALAPAVIASTSPSSAASRTVQLSLPVSQVMSRTSSSESQNARIAIPKAPIQYSRATNDKIKCNKCDIRPEGYRGEHELMRHQIRAHEPKRKAYICKEAEVGGTYLSDCSQCNSLKMYNAYYNAAAHLRRKHFNQKPKGEKRKGKLKPEERRGGKGGGTEPPMNELKKWMYECEIFADGEPVHEIDQIYSPSRRIEFLQASQYAPDFDAVDVDVSLRPCENALDTTYEFTSNAASFQLSPISTPFTHQQKSSSSFDTDTTLTLSQQTENSDDPIHEVPSQVSPDTDPVLFETQLYDQYSDMSFDDMFPSSQP